MILSCNYEELRALESGAELILSEYAHHSQGAVAAPVEVLTQVERLRPRLGAGPLSIDSLADQRAVRGAVAFICESLHDRLESKVLEFHPAHEEAVSLYFDYAHVIAVLKRLDEMGSEMSALIELMTGEPPTPEAAASVSFPD